MRYAVYCSRAYDAFAEKRYEDALSYYNRADEVIGSANESRLLDQDLLSRAQLQRRLQLYAESLEDVRLAIAKIRKKNCSSADKDYLLYYAARVGALSQSAKEDIAEASVDPEFLHLTRSKPDKTKVSGSILRSFPLKSRDK